MSSLIRAMVCAAMVLSPAAVGAEQSGLIRVINVTGQPMDQVTVAPCRGGGVVARLDRGETLRPYADRLWSLAPGCYVVRASGLSARVDVRPGNSHDAPLM